MEGVNDEFKTRVAQQAEAKKESIPYMEALGASGADRSKRQAKFES